MACGKVEAHQQSPVLRRWLEDVFGGNDAGSPATPPSPDRVPARHPSLNRFVAAFDDAASEDDGPCSCSSLSLPVSQWQRHPSLDIFVRSFDNEIIEIDDAQSEAASPGSNDNDRMMYKGEVARALAAVKLARKAKAGGAQDLNV